MCTFLFNTSQVVWLGQPVTESSWEPSSGIPASMINEFENGIHRVIDEQSYTSVGQTTFTLSSVLQQKNTDMVPPEAKRVRSDDAIESSNM